MTFTSDPARQKAFNRQSYRQDPYWQSRKAGRTGWILAAILIPCVAMVFTWLANRGQDPILLVCFLLIAALLPELILLPVAILRYKSDHRASIPECAGRYGDTLLLSGSQLVYTYRNSRDGYPAPQYEVLIPYSLIGRAVLLRRRQILMLYAGGSDSCLADNGTLIRRINYLTGNGVVNKHMRWVEIPMTYPDSTLLLHQLEQTAGITVECSDQLDLDIA